MNESLFIKFLYKSIIGRIILKILINPKLSRASAAYLSSRSSRWLVPLFVHKNHIEMEYYCVPKGGYQSFNDFFTRKMKDKYIWHTNGALISPCDGLLTVSDITSESVFYIKNTEYSLKQLLMSEERAKEYQDGTALIFRLTPSHYHRYIWSTTGLVCGKKKIQGILHSVQPICHEKTKVFIQNTREYSIINNPLLGKVIQMEIGALLVGKISNHDLVSKQIVCSGEEKGFFEYGGSSIVVLTKKRVNLAESILDRDLVGNEIPVVIGECLIK